MDEFQHPLSSPPLRGPTESPTPIVDMTTNLKTHKENNIQQATNQFDAQAPPDSRMLRGRSKSVALSTFAWTLNSPRPPIDFAVPAPSAVNGVPYKARSWEPTLEKAIRAIVSIKASHVRSFDTETSGKLLYTKNSF